MQAQLCARLPGDATASRSQHPSSQTNASARNCAKCSVTFGPRRIAKREQGSKEGHCMLLCETVSRIEQSAQNVMPCSL